MSKIGSAGQSGILLYGPGGLRIKALESNLYALTPDQQELVNRAKKYATEQSIKSIMSKQAPPTNQQQQQKFMQRYQALVLMCRVYVGSISFELREESVKASFAPFGTIKSINMSWDPVTLKHKGFAFVEYELPEAAQLALEHMNGEQLGSRQIKVGRPSNIPQAAHVIHQIQEECKQNNRIYVSNVHPDLSEQELANLFDPFGRVRTCRLAMTPNVDQAQHRGCGFVEFDNEEAATEALTINKLDLGGTILYVCRATTPAENVTSYGTLDPGLSQTSGNATTGSMNAGTATTSNQFHADEDIQDQLERANREQDTQSSETDDTLTPNNNNNSNNAHENNQQCVNDQINNSQTLTTTEVSNHEREKNDLSNILVLKNMVTPDEDMDDGLMLDVYEECSKHGAISQVVIHVDKRKKPNELTNEDNNSIDQNNATISHQTDNDTGEEAEDKKGLQDDEVRIFVKYTNSDSSQRARAALNGRYFAGRKVSAEHYDKEAFRRSNYSAN